MNCMKNQQNGPSGVAIELFKAGGDKCLISLTNIFNDIMFEDKLPGKWTLSLLVPIFKEKGNPLNPDCYRGIKLLEHTFELYGVLDGCLHEVVDIDKCNVGLCQGEGLLMLCLF